MKTEIREIPTITKTYVYIASDNTEFTSEKDCREYEASLYKAKARVINTAVGITSFYDELPAKIYHIINEEEWNYLYYCIWETNVYGSFEGSNYYIAVQNDLGDHKPEYYIKTVNEYLENIQKEVNEYDRETFLCLNRLVYNEGVLKE